MIMRKILILILMVISYSSFGQGNTTYQSATNTTVQFAGGLGATKRWSIPVYADTAAANSYYSTYPNFTKSGNVIYTSGNKYFWYNNGSMWLRLPDYATVQSLISSGNGLQWADTNVLATKYYVSQNGGGSSIDTTALSNRIEQRIKYSDTGTSIIVTQAELNVLLSDKLNISDTSSLLVTHSDLNSAIAGIVPIDTTALSNRINLKQNISDTAGWDATKSYVNNATSGKQNTTDTTSWDATKADLNSGLSTKENSFSKGSIIQGSGVSISGTLANRLVGAGDITISATGSAGYVQWNDTTGQLPTKFQVDTAKSNIRAQIPTNNNQLANGRRYIDSVSKSNDTVYVWRQGVKEFAHLDAAGGGGSGDSIVSFGKNATRDSFVIITSSGRRLAATDSFTVYSAGRGINVIGSTIGLDTTRAYTWLAPQSISSGTTPQRTVINGSGSFTESLSSAGAVTFDAVGTSAGFTFSDRVAIVSNIGSTVTTLSSGQLTVAHGYLFDNSLSNYSASFGSNTTNGVRMGIVGVTNKPAIQSVNSSAVDALILQPFGNNIGVGANFVPTARIHIAAGTATANTAPLKLTLGTDNTTAETGAVEFSNVSGIPRLSFVPSGTTRRRFPLTNDVAPANGQIPIGNGTDYTVANITAGSGISVTNGAGSITIAATGGGGSSTSLDSLRLGGNVNVVGQLVNQSFATGSLPTGWSKGSTLTANYTANGTLITAPATWAYNGAGAYQTPINAAFQYDAKRMPYEDIDMEIDLVVNTVTSNTHMVFTKINNGFFLGNSIVPWTFNLSNGFGSGRVTQSAGLTSNAGDSTARNPIRSGDTITLTWSKSGWGVVAGIINRTTGITTKSYFNNLYNDAGGLYNFVFQNGGANAYTLRAIRVSSKARKGGVCFIGDSQLSGSFATSEASRYANLTMRNNYKYFNVVGLPSVSARYFFLGNIIDEIMADVQPEVVVNALGNNDQVDAGGSGVDNFRDAMDSINTRAQRGGATVFIVGNTPRTNTTADAFYDTTQALAARRNIPFVPSRTFLTDGSGRARASLFPDGLHGNDSMHILIANSLLSMAGERLNRYFVRDTNSILNIAGLPTASDNVTELIARQKDGKAVVVPYFPPSRKYVENQWFTGLPVGTYPFTSPQNVVIDASSFLRSRDHLSVLSPNGLQIGHYVPGAADKRSNIAIGNWIHGSGNDAQGFPQNEGKRIISISARGGSVPRMHTAADLSTFINSAQNNQTGANGFNGRNITAIDCGTCNTLNDALRGVYIGESSGGVIDGTGNITISTSESGTGERSNTIILGRIDQMFNNDAPQSGDIGLHAGATPSLWIGGRAAGGNSILNFTATSGTNAAGGIGSIRAPRGTGTGATGSLRLQVWQSTTSGTTFHSNTIDMVTLDADGITFGAAARLRGYTVATLPTGREGDTAYVTDANATTPGTTVAGGGANKVKVWFNGTNWVID